MQVNAQFPTQIWDGLSPNTWRKFAFQDLAPDHLDWSQITVEVIATQTALKNHIDTAGGGEGCHVKIGQFTCPGATGNYSVTGLGFKPKSVKFWVSKGPGLQTHFCCCQGMMDDSGNQNSMTWAGVFSNIFKGDSRVDLCMYTINSSGNSQVTAAFVSMDDDGFTVNFTVVNPAFIVRWEAIG